MKRFFVLIILVLILFTAVSSRRKTIWIYSSMTEDAITDVNLLRELNLNFKIEVVTDSNLSAYIGESKSKRILNSKFKGVDSYLSSRIKTEILSTYGGIWLDRVYHYDDPILYVDSPCKVFTSLNNKHETFPYVVCKSSHPYIKRWSEIVKSIEDYNEIEDFLKIVNEKYLKGLTDDKAEIKNFIGEITARIALENFDIRVYRDSLAIMDRGEPIEEEEEYEIRLIKRDKPVSEIEDSNNKEACDQSSRNSCKVQIETNSKTYRNLEDLELSRIYVINLKKRKERHASISRQMDILKLPFTLFNAIDGEMLDKSYQENKSLSDLGLDQRIKMNLDKTGSYVNANNLNINWGSVGKWLSHLTLYLEIMDNHKNDEAILILEDDVVIDRDFKKKFKDFLNDVPSNWEFLALGFCGNKSHKIKKSVYKIDKMSCSHAYILRGSKVAEKMFNHLNDEVAKVIDINWMRLFDGKMESYHIWPILISQRKTYASDVNQTSFYIKEVNNPL